MKMAGNVLTMVERADDEFIKILQSTDAHSTDYVTKYNIYLLLCVCLCSYVCIYVQWKEYIVIHFVYVYVP